MSKQEEIKSTLRHFKFIAGDNISRTELPLIVRFIDIRSRKIELLGIREYHAVISPKYRKSEIIEFFCNLKPFERQKLLINCPDMIVALPSDCKLLGVARPAAIAKRSGNFSGKTVEYDVFSIVSVLELTASLNILSTS
jgi:hypothetical protein